MLFVIFDATSVLMRFRPAVAVTDFMLAHQNHQLAVLFTARQHDVPRRPMLDSAPAAASWLGRGKQGSIQ
jgi:hypothetical protein